MEPRLRRELINTPLYCVGEKTADAARLQGFHNINIADGDGKSLAEIAKKDFPHGGHLLYLTGTPRKPVLEDELKAAGLDVLAVDLYRAEPIADWPNSIKRAAQSVTIILHYSRATAEALLALIARDPFLNKLRDSRHLCFSADVAIALRNVGIANIEIASKPNEIALFGLISRKDL
jgi:uroporphyrinogen-III synthase